jgi:GNAT superfamily N-acetyltransferase
VGVPHHLIRAKMDSVGARIDKLMARLDAQEIEAFLVRQDDFDESAHPRGQPKNAGQFASKGEAQTPEAVAHTEPSQGAIHAHVGGDFAGEAHLSPGGHPFVSHLHVEDEHRGKGIGHGLINAAEKKVGRPLVPPPHGMTPGHAEIWKKRLNEMPTDQARKLLAESKEIGSKMGVKPETVDKHHAPLHDVVNGHQHPGHGYSKDAFLDGEGRIHTSNVEDAARALYENKRVVLAQPRQVSTLIEHLGKVSAQMIRLGGKAPVFDLCKVSIAGTNLFCAESKGIPRVKMPQMNRALTKEFRKALIKKGYRIDKVEERASYLKATQDQLNGAKVALNAQRIKSGEKKLPRLVVSRDNYILDGHHKWAAVLGLDMRDNKLGDKKMKLARVDADIITLLKEAEEFGAGHADVSQMAAGGGNAPAARKDDDDDEGDDFLVGFDDDEDDVEHLT